MHASHHFALIFLQTFVPRDGPEKSKAHKKSNKKAHKPHELQDEADEVHDLALAPLRTDLGAHGAGQKTTDDGYIHTCIDVER